MQLKSGKHAAELDGGTRISPPVRTGPVRAILSSLHAFAAAGLRPRTPLAKAIVLVLLIKLIGVSAVQIYMAVDDVAPAIDANTMARVIGVAAAGPTILPPR